MGYIARPCSANPHDWLPIGQAVQLPERVYAPHSYSESGQIVSFRVGKIAEHLSGGGVSVQFDGYFPTVDYSPIEARQFCVVH